MTAKRPYTLVVVAVIWGLAARVEATPGGTHRSAEHQPCSPCHTCSAPTRAHPCLRPCPRHEPAGKLSPDMGPDVVILDDLEDLYVPVRFDHHTHAVMAGMSGGCETCHHFTPPDSNHPACRGCHPIEITHEDLSQPGLKGAYHRGCLRCHVEWDRDTACEICHEKKRGGRLEGEATTVCDHSHYAPLELKELIVFKPAAEGMAEVPFHHRNHSRLYERDCTECHQRQSCARCHIQGGDELHPMGEPGAVSLHGTCFRCHDGQRCDDCHGRDPADLFAHGDTGWPLKAYHASLACRTCHGRTGAFRKLDRRCETCHAGGWEAKSFDHRVTGVALDAIHLEADCDSCHTKGPASTPRCDTCHDDGRHYEASRGFAAS